MTITIEKNIPLPARAARTGEAKYPIDQLEVGDSFVVSIGAATLASHARGVAKETDRKFIVRPVVDDAGVKTGSRIWRKA
jgi:hypothetical protein